MVEIIKIMATSFKRYSTQCPRPCGRPPPLTHASTGDSWTLMGKSGSVSCGVIPSFSWVLVHKRFCLEEGGSGEGCFCQEMRVKEGRVGEETEKLMQRGWNLKEFTLCNSSLPEADEVTG